MKSDFELLEIDGIKTPNLSEPAGDLFRSKMLEIKNKVEAKRAIEREERGKRTELEEALRRANNKYLMAADEHEEQEATWQIKEAQKELDKLPDFSKFDINEFAKKLINNPEIAKLKSEALEEHRTKRTDIEAYNKELTKRYNQATKELNRFMAGYQSDSSYGEGAVIFNRYRNA